MYMKEYAIVENKTGLIIDSFSSKELAEKVLEDYIKDGVKCHLEVY